MKTLNILFFTILALGLDISCSSQTTKKENNTQADRAVNIEVLYFHYTRRCATCMAVENVSKEAVAGLYGDKVSFTAYNLDEADGEARGKDLGVSGQTLLIVAGDTKIDITNEGFLNARSNPDKLKQILKERIDPLL